MPVELSLPSIGIVISHYNRPRSLTKLLDALSKQCHTRWEEHDICIVDDGSEPHYTVPDFPRPVRYMYRERDEGSPHLYGNLNKAIATLDKDVIWILQDDLVVDDHSLLALQLLHRAYADTCMIAHLADTAEPDWYQYPGSILPIKSYRQCGSMMWAGLSIPNWWWKEVEGADEDFDGSMGWADVDFGIRLLNAGCNIAMVRGVCCFLDDSESGGSWRNRILTPWRSAHPGEHDPNGVLLWKKWPFMKPEDA